MYPGTRRVHSPDHALAGGAARSSDNDAMRVLASVIHFLGGLAWWVMTFFMIPYLILEGQSVGDALKSSKKTFFSTWGETSPRGSESGSSPSSSVFHWLW